jgi:hypothetical protein
MGGAPRNRNKGPGNIRAGPLADAANVAEEAGMAEDREKISTGPNERALNETIAGTGPGIPDEALAPGEELPQPPSSEEEHRIRERLGAPAEEVDTLPLDGE